MPFHALVCRVILSCATLFSHDPGPIPIVPGIPSFNYKIFSFVLGTFSVIVCIWTLEKESLKYHRNRCDLQIKIHNGYSQVCEAPWIGDDTYIYQYNSDPFSDLNGFYV